MTSSLPSDRHVFDRRAVRRHRERAAARITEYDFLFREVADRLADRLHDVMRDFPLALALGCHGGALGQALTGIGKIGTLVHADLCEAMVRRVAAAAAPVIVADEEVLPFAAARFDLVLSFLAFHVVNDLPGALVQINACLKPDGLFIAALFGGDTLIELRHAFMEAEIAEEGGASPRVAPAIETAEAGALLQRAGFALPVVDIDTITVTYDNPLRLMHELRGMGEANAVQTRRRQFTRRATLMRAAEAYRDLYGTADGRIPATFQVLYLTAWRAHESQQQPLRPGAAKVRLADALGTSEHAAGDTARPK